MGKIKKKRRFRRNKSQKKALMISLSRNLILNSRIKTTEAKAKELRTFVEPLITKAGKKEKREAKKLLSAYFDGEIVDKMVDEIGPKYVERPGGYTRIIKIGSRDSDGAREVFIELV